MADSFEQMVGGGVGMISSLATELQAMAQTPTATATETAGQCTTVAAAAEDEWERCGGSGIEAPGPSGVG